MRRLALALTLCGLTFAARGAPDVVVVDPAAPAHAFPHFWEAMFGSGRAVLSLRDSYRRDLRAVVAATGTRYVRFHGLLHDELGVYDEDRQGRAVYNFSYVDQVYDGLLEAGVRPFVELSFMPAKLAARAERHSFWYAPYIAPPKDYARWDALMEALARHLVDRYGIEEVGQWYFEVWNEPNLGFWGGHPRQDTYWELYAHTARALKRVDARLRVGGPATAQAAWVGDFLRYAAAHDLPVDFVSTHVYANDTPENVFGSHEPVPREAMVCRAVRRVHEQIAASSRPGLPLIWSEFNASYMNEPAVTDAAYMGPWLAETIRGCDGLVDLMSYWTFSDVFEEGGVVRTPFYGGFGLFAAGGIPKPAFNAFALLHRLGEERLALTTPGALLTRRQDGTLVLALWNYAPPATDGPDRSVRVEFRGRSPAAVRIERVDPTHGDVADLYRRLGAPRYPSPADLVALRAAAELPAPEHQRPLDGAVAVEIPAHGLVLVTTE
ncbi:MAG: glycosyl hydrolase family 39 [Proteobacteria bacterium]|nr:glycosyl hydrolase family 39 [Pseudomonadota bacterium]